MGNKTSLSAILTAQFETVYTASTGTTSKTVSTDSMGRVGYSRYGIDLPNFRYLIATGNDAHTNLSVTKRSIKWQPGMVCRRTYSGTSWTERCSNHAGLKPISLSGHLGGGALLDVEQIAKIGFLKKIRSTREAFGGQEFLGEISQTIGMLRHPLRALMDLGNDLVAAKSADPCRLQKTPRGYRKCRRRLEKRNKLLKRQSPAAVGAAWLEFQFGARPLLGMIGDIADQLTDYIEPGLKRVSYRASAEDATSNIANGNDVNYALIRFSEIKKTVVEHKLRCQIVRTGNIDKGSITQLRETGFAWDSVIPTVWELLPMSVFIDYVSNIGDLISAGCVSLTGVQNLSQTIVQETSFKRGDMVMIPTTGTTAARNTITTAFSSPKFESTEVSIGRIRPNLRIDSSFRVRLPSSGQGLNLAAFLATLLK